MINNNNNNNFDSTINNITAQFSNINFNDNNNLNNNSNNKSQESYNNNLNKLYMFNNEHQSLSSEIESKKQFIKVLNETVSTVKNRRDLLSKNKGELNEKKDPCQNKTEKLNLRKKLIKRDRIIGELKVKEKIYEQKLAKNQREVEELQMKLNYVNHELNNLKYKFKCYENGYKHLRTENGRVYKKIIDNYEYAQKEFHSKCQDKNDLTYKLSMKNFHKTLLKDKIIDIEHELNETNNYNNNNNNNNNTNLNNSQSKKSLESKFYYHYIMNAQTPYAVFGGIVEPGQVLTNEKRKSIDSFYRKASKYVHPDVSKMDDSAFKKLKNFYDIILE